MKKLFLLMAVLAFLLPIRAQTIPAQANLTASDSGSCATAGACLAVNVTNSAASSVVQLTGTWSATVQFEATSKNGGTFVAINAVPLGGSTAVTSATANGAWRIAISGVAQLRVRCSAFTSGTITVAITSSTGSSAQNSGGGGGGGGITPPAGDIGGTTGSPTVVGLESLPLPTLAAMTGCLFDNAGTLQLVTGCNSGISSVAAYFSTTGGVLQLGGQSSQSGAFDSLAPAAGSGKGDLMISNSSQVWVDFTHNTTGTAFLEEDNTGAASWVSIGGFANTNLSNLGTTSINSDLLPASAGSNSLGSALLPWANLYFNGSIINTTASPWIWTGVEGSCTGAAAGKDVLCIGDSTTHQVLESDNGGAFHALGSLSGQTIGSLPLASSATASTSSSLFTDNGTTGAYTGTGGFTAPSFFASGTTAGFFQCTQGSANGHATANTITDECPASVTAYEFVRPGAAATGIPHWSNSAGVVTASISLIAAADMNAQYSKGSCTEVWGGSGTSFAMQAGDDVISNNSCYNDSGVTRTITALKCRSDNAANTTVLTPTFGSAGTGTAILTGTVTCGNSYAYSATGTLNNTAWTTGTGIDPGMSTVGNATSIAMIVEYTF